MSDESVLDLGEQQSTLELRAAHRVFRDAEFAVQDAHYQLDRAQKRRGEAQKALWEAQRFFDLVVLGIVPPRPAETTSEEIG